MDARQVDVDVLHIHGSLDKTEKFNLIKIFVSQIQIDDFNPRIVVGTSATDLGIDKDNLLRVQIYEWPDNVGTYGQRRGRAGRNMENCVCSMTSGLASYVATVARIYREQGSANDNVDYTIAGLNTDVTPMKRKKCTPASKGSDLTLAERRRFRDTELEDIHDVISMFCLDLGCQHRRLMYYFANGRMTDVPPVVQFCGSSCPICTGKWHDQFLSVRKEAVYQWLDFVRDALPVKATIDCLFALLWKQTEWVNAIFDK